MSYFGRWSFTGCLIFAAATAVQGADDDYSQALALLGKAIQLESRNPNHYYERARIHLQVDAYASAISDLNEAIRIDSRFTPAYGARAFAHKQKRQIQTTRPPP